MYIIKNFFYLSKAHPLPPVPKTPLEQAYMNKDLLGARNVQMSLQEELLIFDNFLLPILTISKNFNTQRGTWSKGTDKNQ